MNTNLNKLSYAVFPILVYIIIYEAVIALGSLLIQRGISYGNSFVIQYEGMWSVMTVAAAAACSLLFVWKSAKEEIYFREHAGRRSPVPEKADAKLWFAVLFVFVISLAFTLNIILSLASGRASANASSEALRMQSEAGLPLCIAVYGLFTPLAEESAFRALGFGRVERATSTWPAICLTAGLFALYHGNLQQMIYAFVMGIVLALIYSKTSRFIVPYALHASVNSVMLIASFSGLYNMLCTPSWAVTFFATALMTAGMLYFMKNQHKN